MSASLLVFDSGVGGLSISDEIARMHPDCRINYCSDNAFFPYGTKSEAELVERVAQVLRAALKRHPADIIVIACNSASTLALPHIRSEFSIPIVGVVPAIKPAAASSQTKHIALLATEGTIARPYTDELISEFASNCHVARHGSQKMVELAEQKLRGLNISDEDIDGILRPIFIPDPVQVIKFSPQQTLIDTLVLACTHFPLLKNEISMWLESHLDHKVNIIDSGTAIANRVGYWLEQLPGENKIPKEDSIAMLTLDNPAARLLQAAFENRGFASLEFI